MMKYLAKTFTKLILFSILFCLFSLPCFAQVRRVPAAAIVEQGLTAITLDVEGAENFRYAGQKDKMHTYLGKISPESKLKFVIRATLKNEKELPITGRSSLVRMQVVVKKGDTVLKTENFRKENMSNLYLNYTVPKDADTLEVVESFVLTNKSQDSKFNQKVTTVNKLILSTVDSGSAGAAGNQENNGKEKKETPGVTDKKEKGKENNGIGSKTEKPEKNIDPEAEANIRFTRIWSGAAFLALLAGVGIYFFLKNRKINQVAAETLARKEQLRLQAIQRQKQLQPNGMQESETQDNKTDERELNHKQPEEMPEEGQRTGSPAEDTLLQDDSPQEISQAGGLNAAAAAGTVQTQFCQNCGAPLKPGSKFCESCGSKV